MNDNPVVKSVPVWIDCKDPECHERAGFAVRTTEGGVKKDFYVCDNGHETSVPVE